jgi:hypothetical protein
MAKGNQSFLKISSDIHPMGAKLNTHKGLQGKLEEKCHLFQATTPPRAFVLR